MLNWNKKSSRPPLPDSYEVMRIFKKGQMDIWKYGQGIKGEIRIITDNLLAY